MSEVVNSTGTIKRIHDFPLDHEGFANYRDEARSRPYGSWVEIKTERTQTGEQIGDVVLHSVVDAGYLYKMFQSLRSNPSDFSIVPDHRRTIAFIETELMKRNLFGKNKNYQALFPTGCPNPPNLGTVLYASGMPPHYKGCQNAKGGIYDVNPPEPKRGWVPPCPACKQYKQNAILRMFGWTVQDPPLRHSKSMNGVTVERFMKLQDETKKLAISAEEMERLKLNAEQKNIDAVLSWLTAYEERVSYAEREVDDVFARVEGDLDVLSQKQIDTGIAERIAKIAAFAQLSGGLHVIGLVAGDSDFTQVVRRAILDSSWSRSAKTKHKTPRLKIVVFHTRGTADSFLTGEGFKTKQYTTQRALNNKYCDEIVVDALSGCEMTPDMLRSIAYSRFRNDNSDSQSVNY